MTPFKKSKINNLVTAYICSVYKLEHAQANEIEKASKVKDETKSHEHLPYTPLLISTPTYSIAIPKGPTTTKRVASLLVNLEIPYTAGD